MYPIKIIKTYIKRHFFPYKTWEYEAILTGGKYHMENKTKTSLGWAVLRSGEAMASWASFTQ